MKTIRTIHTALILMVLAFLSACSTDSADPIQGDNGGDNPGDKVTVHMTLSTAPSSGTRATLSWNDGVDAENMKSWVVAFVKDGKVVFENRVSSSLTGLSREANLPRINTAPAQILSISYCTAKQAPWSNPKSLLFTARTHTSNYLICLIKQAFRQKRAGARCCFFSGK